jgi:subtilisin family serine protease
LFGGGVPLARHAWADPVKPAPEEILDLPAAPPHLTDLNWFPSVIQPEPTLNLSRDTSRLFLSLTIDQERLNIEQELSSLPVVLEDHDDECSTPHRRRVVHSKRRYWIRSKTCNTAITQATVTAIHAKLTSLVAWIGPIYAYPNASDRTGLVGVQPEVLIIQLKKQVSDTMFQRLTTHMASEGFTRVPGMEKDFQGFHFFKNTSSLRNSSFEVRTRLVASSSWRDMIEAVRFSYRPMLSSTGMVPLDSRYATQWNMWRIKAGEDPAVCSTSSGPQGSGWDLSIGDGSVAIWILDAGCCDERHPDLRNRLVSNEGTDFRYYPVTENISSLGAFRPRSDHTTAVAGVLAASITPPPSPFPCPSSSGQGLAGVAGNCKIYPLAVEETATAYEVGAAIRWAATNATLNNARVLCITIGRAWNGVAPEGWPDYNTFIEPSLSDAWNISGLVICVLTHNDGANSIRYPATSPYVMACGATDQFDSRASFSNYGQQMSVVAPAQYILSLNWCQGTSNCGVDGYRWVTGTSFATPQVAGLAALLLSKFPCLTNQEVRQIIESSATPLSYHSGSGAIMKNGKLWHEAVGYGLINVKAALEAPPILKCMATPPHRDLTPPAPPTGLHID